MTSKKELISLEFSFFEDSYEKNYKKLESLIQKTPANSVIVAPELCLTNFSFDNLEEASSFSQVALNNLLQLSKMKIITLTVCEKIDDKYYNSAKILYNGEIVYSQSKAKLFRFGHEDKYFHAGSEKDIKIIEIDGLKYAILICFEIRFIQLWQQIQGADIILIPALWGKQRKMQFETITKSLAILNQAFVIASNSSNDDMASSSAIITPFGKESRQVSSKGFISLQADIKEITKMRRYMDIGLK